MKTTYILPYAAYVCPPLDETEEIYPTIGPTPEVQVSDIVEETKEVALRYNEGKPRYDLIPMDALEELAKIYSYGSLKYAPHNWSKGMSWSQTQASLMRHLSKWAQGEDVDEESGLQHMAHVAWNAMTLVAFMKREVGTDDRFKTIV